MPRTRALVSLGRRRSLRRLRPSSDLRRGSMRRRFLAAAAALAALVAASPGPDAGADGTILQSGARIEAGFADTRGTVVVDECAPDEPPPEAPPLGAVGTN